VSGFRLALGYRQDVYNLLDTDFTDCMDDIITPAINYTTAVFPAKAGIQKGTGYRIKSGMTELAI